MKVIVLFKTHLDIGYTDFSANVVRKYGEIYIPQAIHVAEEIARLNRPEGFVWTVGSWLVAQYLENAGEEQRKLLCDAIDRGWVSWHGLPFTMHSEYCSAELFEYGLSISKELDRRFSRKTIGAKYTDVPGHTAAIIPHLADNGIRFLHIGVNPASAPVDVPDVFRWQFGGKEITVMYNGGYYGELTQIPGTETSVYFAHTNDNLGPQSADEVLRIYDEIHAKFPEAEVIAGTLNDVANEVERVSASLPVITGEMGDSWIHGMGTDPRKTSQYKALLRWCDAQNEETKQALYKHLVLVPEHTWGLSNSFIHEYENYIKPRFRRVRDNHNYKIMELSWAEQRKYVLDAAACITDRAAAEPLLNSWYTDFPDLSGLDPVAGNSASVGGMQVVFSENGVPVSLIYPGADLRIENGTLFGFSYDEYSADEVTAFCESYLKQGFIDDFRSSGEINWAIRDFGKFGLQDERNEHTSSAPLAYRLFRDDASLYAVYETDPAVTARHGLPGKCLLKITPRGQDVLFDFSWYDKPANRAPEALWLDFNPGMKLCGVSKLGHLIDPANVLPRGGRGLHGTDGRVVFEGVTVELLDSALVSVGKKNVYRFETDDPNLENGVFFNLFNNQWNTNFPMWNEGDGRARFVLSAGKPQ